MSAQMKTNEVIDLTERLAYTTEELENSRRIFLQLAPKWRGPKPALQGAVAWNRRVASLQLKDLIAWLTYRTDEPPSNLVQLSQLLLGDPSDSDTRLLRHVLKQKVQKDETS